MGRPADPVIVTETYFQARTLSNPNSPKGSSWEAVQDQENCDSGPVEGSDYDTVLSEAIETLRCNADDDAVDLSDLVIARVTVEYIKPRLP